MTHPLCAHIRECVNIAGWDGVTMSYVNTSRDVSTFGLCVHIGGWDGVTMDYVRT